MPPLDEYIAEIQTLWDTHQLTNMGEKHQLLEKELTDFLAVKQLSLMVNGHMALEMAIQALKLEGEVITTPYTFASTTHAIVRNGLQPVFCDIKEDDFTIDPSRIEGLITAKTSAILPVHVYGNICDVEAIDRIANKYHLKVLYDAAHTFGEFLHGVGVGTFGNASVFSFHATKVFNTIEGGAVTFSNPDMYLDLYRLKNFGIRGPEEVDWVGSNAKMNEFQAAMGLCNLRHFKEEIVRRQVVFERYCANLDRVAGLRLNKVQVGLTSNYAYFPIVIDPEQFGAGRNEVFAALERQGISARKYFYPLTNSFDCFAGRFDINETPTALRISQQILTLPIYADLSLTDVDRICAIIMAMKNGDC